MAELDGTVVIITPAGGGLGHEYALLLADEGARVVVSDLGGIPRRIGIRTGHGGQRVDEIRQLGGTARANCDNIAAADGA
jgi:NAD(P)-dependent dehydrogenase (short-subunit alcohol dehydrogenase family)